jgi:hypothetical protein
MYTAWVHGLNICVHVFGQDCVSVGVGVGLGGGEWVGARTSNTPATALSRSRLDASGTHVKAVPNAGLITSFVRRPSACTSSPPMSIGCGEPDDDAEDGAPLAATRCPAWRANTIERVCALHFST